MHIAVIPKFFNSSVSWSLKSPLSLPTCGSILIKSGRSRRVFPYSPSSINLLRIVCIHVYPSPLFHGEPLGYGGSLNKT